MTKFATLLSFILLLMLVGCGPHKSASFALHGGGKLQLAQPGPAPVGTAYTQFMRIEHKNGRFEFEAQVESEGDRLTVIGLTPVGSRGFAARWVDGQLSFEHIPFYRLPISAAELLSAWQLANLDPEQLAPLLDAADSSLSIAAQTRERVFLRRGKIWARVRYQTEHNDGIALVEYLGRGFNLAIKTRAREDYPLP